MRTITLSLLAAAGFVFAACVQPQPRLARKRVSCDRIRERLASDPNNPKLQRYAATYCPDLVAQPQDSTQPSQSQPSQSGSPRCRRLQAYQERHPDNLKVQRAIARYCPPPAAAEQAAVPAAAAPADAPAVAEETPAPAAAPPAVPEKPRELTPEETDAVNEELLP